MVRWYDRTAILLGEESYQALRHKSVLIVGVGGVGGMAAEFICRAGIGTITIVDSDVVSIDNRNRQIIALESTTGEAKVEVLAKRLKDINPELDIMAKKIYLLDEEVDKLLDERHYDYVVDAIDTLTPKVQLITGCLKRGIKLISSMGAGGKFDPSKIEVVDISKTYRCPLAQKVRKMLRQQKIDSGVLTIFSAEEVDKSKFIKTEGLSNKKTTVGTISYMPPMFGAFAASVVIRELSGV
ncbi:MAG: tRNA threonylcarbamoyladenosine dehydratase [Bdellovibrionales bacterium RIFOXYD12_FULL_39_22]|nr:MAG: tRNA threonylcarbamoyladenosine dehydratase [Bdellovibrionales bacterium RIFOXYB1_FULL_39_21]OFZ43736.1 MAG: tRNA threonylcarbamoyladenosine dehydratase [Bdellovibrionales bacterium RIFOXYC12_FULL_39_17]OFZ48093.1 MAG: tRNA threonylcarbamoyladenosine dehydratase [Bdellovibrionales bacterium RIFOXYC1_FULL_39_130]OFZ77244.1 MAG: tRNA threonylcarbamoyladenosine dehydratase [Bdellovibrionales bacterium RIFOXYD1_FULL_39_84]OFZ95696.1 MAG: tRNA threonylcarbamoyladenosine dehydratase [Bdellovi